MDENRVKAVFRDEQREIALERLSIAFNYMATPLVLSFAGIDYIFRPQLLVPFLKLRLLVIPAAFICYRLLKIPKVRLNYFEMPAYIFCLFLGVLNAYFAMRTGAEASPYYAGLNLVGVGAIIFLPLGFACDAICSICIYLPYFVMLPFYTSHIDFSLFVPHSAFMFSTIFLGGVAKIYFRKISFVEMRSRLALEHEMKSKEEIISRKTQEGVYLEGLARQFSPQVIDAIKTGDVSIESEIRREITIIFIDSQSSTHRSTRIDHDEYLGVIKDFYTRCTEILLRHNITTGTFLGDGLMAFVNAPKLTKNHRLAATTACLEILKMRAEREKFYQDRWKNKFSIRIGINTGFAQVGFFPSQQRGTYTVIGAPVNLAARLCSVAEPNSITVAKSFLKEIASEVADVDIRKLEVRDDIKGMEGELIEIFAIGSKIASDESSLLSCRLCDGKMAISADFGDTVLIKCTSCGRFTDIIEKEAAISSFTPSSDQKAA